MFEPAFRNMDDALRKEAGGFDPVIADSTSDVRASEQELRRQLIESRTTQCVVAMSALN